MSETQRQYCAFKFIICLFIIIKVLVLKSKDEITTTTTTQFVASNSKSLCFLICLQGSAVHKACANGPSTFRGGQPVPQPPQPHLPPPEFADLPSPSDHRPSQPGKIFNHNLQTITVVPKYCSGFCKCSKRKSNLSTLSR